MFLGEACTVVHLINIITRERAGRKVSTGSAYYEYILRFTGAELMQRGYLPVSLLRLVSCDPPSSNGVFCVNINPAAPS
jgi:hypothetical protein